MIRVGFKLMQRYIFFVHKITQEIQYMKKGIEEPFQQKSVCDACIIHALILI